PPRGRVGAGRVNLARRGRGGGSRHLDPGDDRNQVGRRDEANRSGGGLGVRDPGHVPHRAEPDEQQEDARAPRLDAQADWPPRGRQVKHLHCRHDPRFLITFP
ncbi:hypothetical protein B8W95_12960, partial [Staphylococcus pasteuri]